MDNENHRLPARDISTFDPDTFCGLPEPFRTALGPFEERNLSDPFALTQFGVTLCTLPPGSQSALRHWHSRSDEWVWMVSGTLTLITDEGKTTLRPGMCAGFPAGAENGHHLVNESSADATFIVVGSRVPNDRVTYPDDDFHWAGGADGAWFAARRDGTPYT